MATKCTAAAVIAEARKWVGYLEKKSNAQLDSFTANAGSNNYTRFGRDYAAATGDKSALPEQWCGEFVSMVFVYAFGLATAKKLLCGPLYKYTPSGAASFKKAGKYIKRGQGTPKPGDVVFFWSSSKGRIGHTGIVERVTSSRVYTIEGNTSGGTTLITNGGCVAAKSYSLSSSYIDGYGRPNYASASTGVEAKSLELGDRLLVNGMTGEDVKELQAALIRLGYSCGSWGADGEFGDATEMAVRHYQKQNDLLVDGEAGPQTVAALKKAMAALDAKVESPANVTIAGGNCYIRSEPSTAGAIRGVATEKAIYPYDGETSAGGWLAIQYKGSRGWVSGKYGRLTK